jgi:hypothetical protein
MEKETCSRCGEEIKVFMHTCPASSNMVETKGCPVCDDHCPECLEYEDEKLCL